ncbi:CPBP family intramembrane glutamic endopeptidase [Amycolatopsis keratiniphila]|uniref:CPBP family intramembrane glutamic endopeptidase n=1 Tax=Amycolatopsis keratiniphila TaxID=129921 RepID=UPI000879DF53|nr:type II CAAX endopeptidase family protein [Amycolatopsis keratiniphila]SDU22044.1 hypothetical protein SAMN04489733_2159 [Amycolatopsis keratiniphila]
MPHTTRTEPRTATVAACLLMAAPVLPGTPWFSLVVAAGLVVSLVAAVRSRSAPGVRAVAVAAAVSAVFHLTILLDWPPAVRIVLALVVVFGLPAGLGRLPSIGTASGRVEPGRLTWPLAAAVVVLIVGTTTALVSWARFTDPVLPGYIVAAKDSPLWQVALAVIAFSLFNAALEEGLFRGVLLDEMATIWSVRAALIVQGVAFGLFHFNGFPSGWTGMVMAGVWGYLLGVLRVRSGGLLLPYIAHIGADATIAVITVAGLSGTHW